MPVVAPLHVAILGTGFIGRLHLEALRRLGTGIQPTALASLDLGQAHSLGEHFGVTRITGDYRELLANSTIDAVHICTRNAMHHTMALDTLRAGKHVLCEKPLGVSTEVCREMAALASSSGLRNCVCHSLRFYPLVQQMRQMCHEGDLGEILAVHGSYLQDWLLLDTDWNWRIDPSESGPSRVMADIGSHWFDMAEFVTGQRVTSLCADLQTFHKRRKRPLHNGQTFADKNAVAGEYEEVTVASEDFGAVIFRMGERTRGSLTASQMAAGRKNRLSIEVHGSKSSMAWDTESPDQLWFGSRQGCNQVMIKDPSLMKSGSAAYADLPGGHTEGFDDTLKQLFRRFYDSIRNPGRVPEYPQFADGMRQLVIVEAELASNSTHSWVKV